MRARRSFRTGSPRSAPEITGWLRLQASEQSGGEWVNYVDVLNSNPAVQADADRKCAVGTSANGLPTMVFDGSDMYQWPLSVTINNMTGPLIFVFFFKPAVVNTIQRLLNATIATGASAGSEKFSLYCVNATLSCEIYRTNTTGRQATTASSVLTAGAWSCIAMQYDHRRGGDANYTMHVDAVQVTNNFANIGAGATLDVLQQPTGNILIGSFNNSDTPTQAIANGGEMGPNLYVGGAILTQAKLDMLNTFERPT